MVVQSLPDVRAERVSVLLFPVLGDVTRPEGVATTDVLGIRILTANVQKAGGLTAGIFFLGLALGAGVTFLLRRRSGNA
jgi:hypothetical protein